MTQVFAFTVLGLMCACAILAFLVRAQAKRAAKAEADAERLHDAFWQLEQRAEYLQKALDGIIEAEEEADEKRNDLAETPDANLVHRANRLFGVPDDKKRS